MPKYAPARENGDKPYVVERYSWGRTDESVVWATKPNEAVYMVVGRQLHTSGKARRATPDDMDRLCPESGASQDNREESA